jgi:hypothetical protein
MMKNNCLNSYSTTDQLFFKADVTAYGDSMKDLSPSHRELLIQLAFIFLQQEKYEKSAMIYDLLFEWYPQDPLVVFPLAFSLIHCQQPEAALDKLKVIRGAFESDPTLWFLRSKAFQNARLPAEAAKAMRMHIRLKSKAKHKESAGWR